MSSRLLTAREAAAILRCHEKTIRRMIPWEGAMVPLLVPLSTADVLGLARAVEAEWERRWVEWAREREAGVA